MPKQKSPINSDIQNLIESRKKALAKKESIGNVSEREDFSKSKTQEKSMKDRIFQPTFSENHAKAGRQKAQLKDFKKEIERTLTH